MSVLLSMFINVFHKICLLVSPFAVTVKMCVKQFLVKAEQPKKKNGDGIMVDRESL